MSPKRPGPFQSSRRPNATPVGWPTSQPWSGLRGCSGAGADEALRCSHSGALFQESLGWPCGQHPAAFRTRPSAMLPRRPVSRGSGESPRCVLEGMSRRHLSPAALSGRRLHIPAELARSRPVGRGQTDTAAGGARGDALAAGPQARGKCMLAWRSRDSHTMPPGASPP